MPDDPGGYVRRIATLARDAALALQAVHDQGVVHRDVKPGNLMLTPDGTRVVLMDFGLAKGQSMTLAASRGGGLLGTLRYAAPEQLAAASLKVGPAADVRGLGVTLWESLTRRRLFEDAEDERQLSARDFGDDVPRLRSVDPSLDRDLEAIVARATERRVEDRIATARELADYLTLYLEGKPLPIRPPTTREFLKRWVLRHKALVASVAAAAVLIVATVVTAFLLITAALVGKQQAESQRALGQVDALLDADPAAVPGLVSELELNRPEVRDRLHQLWADASRPESQHLRVGLALLRTEPDRLGDLEDGVFRAEPREMLVIRDLLPRDDAALRDRLWAVAEAEGTKPEDRLRAAVALARFAPDDPRWAKLAGRIVDPFLSSDLRDLGRWIGALQPVWEDLRDPLTRVFGQADQPEKRVTAARILAVYAADSPEVVADLATRADPRQYVILLPALRKNHDEAVAWLGQEVDRLGEPLTPAWSDAPLDPAWAAPDPDIVRQIEQGQGMVAERFALCQTMPLDRFLAAAEGLRRSGHRPACFRPYAAGRVVQVAAVWQRDGRDWRLAHGVKADEIRKQDDQWRQQGFRPRDVAGYLGESGGKPAEQYAALWTTPEPGEADARLYVGLAYSDVVPAWQKMQTDGLTQRTQFPVNNDLRYSAVWWKPERAPDVRWAPSALEPARYESLLAPNNWQVDVRVDAAAAVLPPRQRQEYLLGQAETALAANKDNLDAHLQRGQMYVRLGQDDKRLADLDQVIAKSPQAINAYFWRALARARLGQPAKAREDVATFQKPILHPGMALVVDVAVSARLGDDAAAVERAEAAQAVVAQKPEPAKAYADRAVALLKQAAARGFIGDNYFSYADVRNAPALDVLWDHPGFRDLMREGQLDRQFSAVWYDSDRLASEESHGLDPEAHLRRCRELAAAGCRAATASASRAPSPSPPKK